MDDDRKDFLAHPSVFWSNFMDCTPYLELRCGIGRIRRKQLEHVDDTAHRPRAYTCVFVLPHAYIHINMPCHIMGDTRQHPILQLPAHPFRVHKTRTTRRLLQLSGCSSFGSPHPALPAAAAADSLAGTKAAGAAAQIAAPTAAAGVPVDAAGPLNVNIVPDHGHVSIHQIVECYVCRS